MIKRKQILPVIAILSLFCTATLPQQLYASPQNPQSLSLSLSFDKPTIKVKIIGNYDLASVSGLSYYLVPGAPIIPVKVLTLKLPYGSKVLGVNYSATYTPLRGVYRILPSPQPQRLDRERKAFPYVEDPKIYSSSSPYPSVPVVYEVKYGLDPFTKERVTYVIIRVFPVRFIPSKGTILYATSFNLRVNYIPGPQKAQAPAIDVVVISGDKLYNASRVLAQWKNSTGHVARVYNVSWILANFPGKDDPEKIRNFINFTVNNYGTLYVILMGDAEVIPARRIYDPSFKNLAYNNPYIESDLYYADLQGTWDTNNNGYYGDLNDTIDGVPDVMVGRIPASTLEEASRAVQKIIAYNPSNSWLRRALLLGTVTFGDPHAPEGEILNDVIEENYLPHNFSWTKLYEGVGNLNATNVMSEISKGYGLVNFAGHGNVDLWYFGSGGYMLTDQVYQLTNGPNASVVATMACLTGDWADTDVSIGEAFVLHSGGAIAYLGAADVAWAYTGYWITQGLAGKIDLSFVASWRKLEDYNVTPTPGQMHLLAIYDYLATYGRANPWDWYTVVEYGTLLGDPTIKLTGTGSPPAPPPEPSLSGWIVDPERKPIANSSIELYDYFNGSLIASQNCSNGYFKFSGLSHGTYVLLARAPGYLARTVDLYYPHMLLQVNITLTPPPSFSFPTVLVVVDDDASYKVDNGTWPADFTTVATSLGFNVYVWNESKQGRPPPEVLQHRNVTVVVWHTGTYYGGVVDPPDAQNLIDFVKRGGSLLLEGEDIGSDHGNDTFMLEVAHSAFLTDYVDTDKIVSTRIHFLTDGLPSASFTSQPPYPDGVIPVNGGFEVMRYSFGGSLTPYSAIVAYDGSPVNEGRVVYIAFPVHYLNADNRRNLLCKAFTWLSTRYRLSLNLSSSISVPGGRVGISAIPFNGTQRMTNLSVVADIFFPNGTLATTLKLVAASNGVFTGVFTVPLAAPSGNYFVVARTEIPNYGREFAYASFAVVTNLTFIINVTHVSVDDGVIHLNVSVCILEGINLSGVEFRVDSGDVLPGVPADGAFDEPCENAFVVFNGTEYSDGTHYIYVRAFSGNVYSKWVSIMFRVRTLTKRYNLIALSIEPRGKLYASDIARAIGKSMSGIWKWDADKQEFVGFIPGVSGPEKNFEVEVGYGYFIYLTGLAKFVEVEGMGA